MKFHKATSHEKVFFEYKCVTTVLLPVLRQKPGPSSVASLAHLSHNYQHHRYIYLSSRLVFITLSRKEFKRLCFLFLVIIMNIIPYTNVMGNSQQHEHSCLSRIRKRSETDAANVASPRQTKKAVWMSEASSDRSSYVAYPLHSINKDIPSVTFCSSQDITTNDEISNLPKMSPPPQTMYGVSSLIPTINTTICNSINNTDWVELHIEFLRTLKKLNKSIQRTDQSRIFFIRALHRHHWMHHNNHHKHNSKNNNNRNGDNELRYFTSPEWYKSQQDRQEFAKIVHHDCL